MNDIPVEVEWTCFTVRQLINIPKSTPNFKYAGDYFCLLKEEYITWLQENNVDYNLKYEFIDGLEVFYILFKNKEHAMLFKLIWC
jgi:hypothetical protein